MYNKKDLIELKKYPGYYIDPVNADVISFKMFPHEGYKLKWNTYSWYYKMVGGCVKLTLANYGKRILTKHDISSIIEEHKKVEQTIERFIVMEDNTSNYFYFHGTDGEVIKEVESQVKNSGKQYSYYKKMGVCSINEVIWRK